MARSLFHPSDPPVVYDDQCAVSLFVRTQLREDTRAGEEGGCVNYALNIVVLYCNVQIVIVLQFNHVVLH